MNEQILAKRALGRARWERQYARNKPPEPSVRRVAAPIEPLPGGGYEPAWRPRHSMFGFDWLRDLLTKQIPPTPKHTDKMGAPRFIEYVDSKGRKLLKDMLAYTSRSKYVPHQGGGQYDSTRNGRHGAQS